MVTAAKAASHVFLSVTRFRVLIDEGVFKRRPARQYDLAAVRREYILHLRKIASGHTGGKLVLADERALLAREQRETAALKNAVQRAQLVSVAAVEKLVENEYSLVRERLVVIPGKIADACAMQPREMVEHIMGNEINEALSELSDPAETDIAGREIAK